MHNVPTILYFGKMDLPYNNASASRVSAICSLLSDLGYNVKAYGLSKSNMGEGYIDGFYFSNGKYPQKTIDYINLFSTSRNIKAILKKTTNINEKITYIFVTSVGFVNLKYLIKFCSNNNIGLIYDNGDMLSTTSGGFFKKILYKLNNVFFNKLAYRNMDFMCISSFLANLVKDRKKIIIPCIYNSKSYKFSFLTNVKYHPTDRLSICYCGDPGYLFSKDKLDIIVSEFLKLNVEKKELIVMGIEKETFLNYCKIVKRDIITNNTVVFLGKQPYDECLKRIVRSDFTILFRSNTISTQSGFPSKIAESLACGTPVITNLTSDLKYYLNGNNSISKIGYNDSDLGDMLRNAASLSKEEKKAMHEFCAKNKNLEISSWKETMEGFLKDVKTK